MASIIDLLLAAAKYGSPILAIYIAGLISYQIFLHPLSKYPGPLLAKITDAYVGYFALRQTLPHATWKNHVKYGPVLRHGPDRLIFNSASALQDIYQSGKAGKSFAYDLTRQANGTVNIFNALDNNVHKRKRRLIGHALNEKAMRSFEPTMSGQIDIFLRRVLSAKQEPVNMTIFLRQLMLDIVSHLAFGYPLDTQTNPRDRWILAGLAFGNYRINSYMNWPALRHVKIDWLVNIIATKGKNQFRELLHRMIQTRTSQDKNAIADLYASVTNEDNLRGDSMPLDEIWQEAGFFISAGGDTTTGAMSALFFYLSRHPGVYKKLTQEIRSTFISSADITGGPKLSSCEYLRVCIEETLRMSPPVGGALWREPATDASLVVDGHVVPHGTQVGVSIFALHHNEEYFPKPFFFKPERWLASETSEEQRKRMSSAFVPFSTGPRSCPGKAVAYLELSLVTAKLLWYFDLEKAPGELGEVGVRRTRIPKTGAIAEEFALYDVFAAHHDGPNIVFRPREETMGELQ